MTDVYLPIRLGRGQNDREHWAKRAARVKKEKNDAWWSLMASSIPRPSPPCRVTITRIALRADTHPLDDDNLSASAKAIRDSIALWLGVDDGDARVEWKYAQEKGQFGVRVSFEARA